MVMRAGAGDARLTRLSYQLGALMAREQLVAQDPASARRLLQSVSGKSPASTLYPMHLLCCRRLVEAEELGRASCSTQYSKGSAVCIILHRVPSRRRPCTVPCMPHAAQSLCPCLAKRAMRLAMRQRVGNVSAGIYRREGWEVPLGAALLELRECASRLKLPEVQPISGPQIPY